MSDPKLIAAFAAAGLVVAWFASAPLRRPSPDAPAEQTARLQDAAPAARVYARGTIEVAPGTPAAFPALFIIARSPQGGAPIAVQRLANPAFPVNFTLTVADAMVGTDFYEGDLVVVARLDNDGSAGPKQEGDLEAHAEVKAGQSRDVRLVIGASQP